MDKTFTINNNEFKVKDSQLVYSLLGHEKKPSDSDLEKYGKSESCKEATEYVMPFEKGVEVVSLLEMITIMNELGIGIDKSFLPNEKILSSIYINKLFVKKIAQAVIYNSISIFEIGDMIKNIIIKSNSLFESMHISSLRIDLDKDGIGNFFKVTENKKKELLNVKMTLSKYLSFGVDQDEEDLDEDNKNHLKSIGEEVEISKNQVIETKPEKTIVPEIITDPIDSSEKYSKTVIDKLDKKKLNLFIDLRTFEKKIKSIDRLGFILTRIDSLIRLRGKDDTMFNDRYKLMTVDEHGFILKGSTKRYMRIYNDKLKPRMFNNYEELKNEFC